MYGPRGNATISAQIMSVEFNVPLQPFNTFGIVAKARALARIGHEDALRALLADPAWRDEPKFVLGGGSNLVLTGDVKPLVLKSELRGRRIVDDGPRHWRVEAEAGENWADFVRWTLAQGMAGLENLTDIPGTVGAAPVQNIGAYGVELQDHFDSLDAIDLVTGEALRLDAAQCGFGYRDSVFKHAAPAAGGLGLAGRAFITRVRLRLPKAWRPMLGYADLEKKIAETGDSTPAPSQIADWIAEIRRHKLPDWRVLGNAGSFFKNPTVTPDQCEDIIAREPGIVHYKLADGRIKLAAAWLIDACGWKGKSVGHAAVYERQALVLVNRGRGADSATGGEVMTLARAIQTSVFERFGIRLEPEPVVL